MKSRHTESNLELCVYVCSYSLALHISPFLFSYLSYISAFYLHGMSPSISSFIFIVFFSEMQQVLRLNIRLWLHATSKMIFSLLPFLFYLHFSVGRDNFSFGFYFIYLMHTHLDFHFHFLFYFLGILPFIIIIHSHTHSHTFFTQHISLHSNAFMNSTFIIFNNSAINGMEWGTYMYRKTGS